jgi:hypothetical protein
MLKFVVLTAVTVLIVATLNEALRREVWGSGDIALRVLSLAIGWK